MRPRGDGYPYHGRRSVAGRRATMRRIASPCGRSRRRLRPGTAPCHALARRADQDHTDGGPITDVQSQEYRVVRSPRYGHPQLSSAWSPDQAWKPTHSLRRDLPARQVVRPLCGQPTSISHQSRRSSQLVKCSTRWREAFASHSPAAGIKRCHSGRKQDQSIEGTGSTSRSSLMSASQTDRCRSATIPARKPQIRRAATNPSCPLPR